VFRTTKAGALYAIIVIVIGFILGTIRVLLLAPRLGETTTVIIEDP
jgi:gas vesicle protein